MGEIITFYSYKGGTGRTMALANTAVLAARETRGRVLMIDWDLEAPGLHRYFQPYTGETKEAKGLFDFVYKAQKKLPKMPYGMEDHALLAKYFAELESYLIPVPLPQNNTQLFLIKAGLFGDDYPKNINNFDWAAFFKRIPSFFPLFAEYLSNHFEYVFIDSRTGHTDVGGICTMSMPEKLVMVFTPNDQSIDGALELAKKSTDYRIKSDDYRPLMIYPLPSRVDLDASQLATEWRNNYEKQWEDTFKKVYGLPSTISLKKYFDSTRIRHDAIYAYGERLAVVENNTIEIAQNFRSFSTQLLNVRKIWENQPFANIVKPYELSYVFTNDDRPHVELFTKSLHALRNQNVLNWSESQLKPVEDWDDTLKRKLASGISDLTVVFLSKALYQNNRWPSIIKELAHQYNKSGKGKIVPILLENLNYNGLFGGTTMLPGRNKSLDSWSDPDDAWLQVTEQFKREVVKLNEKIQQNGK
jgi:cellulose biosynthesis protein BcsQ